jgi:hypothetical protein
MTPPPGSDLKGRLLDHTIQGLLIFASVFLAFWLNDYRLQVQEERATATALRAVVEEVEANQAILQRWAPYHWEIRERLEAFLAGQGPEASGGELPELEAFRPWEFLDERGIFQEILTHDSLETLRQTEVRLDIRDRMGINRVFRQQEYVDGAVRAAVEFLGSREAFRDELAGENYVIFYRLISDLYFQQQALLHNYDLLLQQLRTD